MQVKAILDNRIRHFLYKQNKLHQRIRLNGWLRLFVFLVILTFLVASVRIDIWFLSAALAFIVFFAILIKRSRFLNDRHDLYKELIAINQQDLDTLAQNFHDYDSGQDFADPSHPFASDLDLFGKKSLFQFINRCKMPQGRASLANILCNLPTGKKDILERQQSIAELAPLSGLRQKFAATAATNTLQKPDEDKLFTFLSSPISITSKLFFRFARKALPVLTFISLALAIAGFTGWNLFIVIFVLNLFITGNFIKYTNHIHGKLEDQSRRLEKLASLLGIIMSRHFETPYLQHIQANIKSDNINGLQEINQFRKLVNTFDARLNYLVGIVLNGLLLWDMHCLHQLEKWRIAHGHKVSGYLEVLGQTESLFSFANMAWLYPETIIPEVNHKFIVHAHQAGHPLIPEKNRVNNDISLRESGEIIIITGANMAGKSTFLRTIGINHILACCGAPVFANKYVFAPLPLFSSMRTSDNLGENESYFYAELKRLKQLADMVKKGNKTLFLLDEILKGTNSNDKLNGSIAFLKKLIAHNASGIIATHDIKLTEMQEEYPHYIANKCFEITISEGKMEFDYQLQDGVTQRMNALLLMQQLNII